MNAKSKKKSALLGLSVVFVVSMGILLLGVNGVIGSLSLTGGNVVFGNSIVGSTTDQNDPNAQTMTYFTCNTAGSVTDVVAYISGASDGNAKAALYGDDGSLISQSNSVSIGTVFSWVDFPLPYAYTTEVGHTYGLALMGDVSVNVALIPSVGQRIAGPGYGDFSQGFTDPFGFQWFSDPVGGLSIYASGSTSAPSPTPTQAPSGTVITVAVTNNNPSEGSYTITAGIGAPTNFNGETIYSYYAGTSITIVSTADSGFQFENYLDATTGVSVAVNPWVTTIGSSITVDVNFSVIGSSPTPSPTPTPVPPVNTSSVSEVILGGGASAISALSLCLVSFGKVKP